MLVWTLGGRDDGRRVPCFVFDRGRQCDDAPHGQAASFDSIPSSAGWQQACHCSKPRPWIMMVVVWSQPCFVCPGTVDEQNQTDALTHTATCVQLSTNSRRLLSFGLLLRLQEKNLKIDELRLAKTDLNIRSFSKNNTRSLL